jgi:hypothetical protein
MKLKHQNQKLEDRTTNAEGRRRFDPRKAFNNNINKENPTTPDKSNPGTPKSRRESLPTTPQRPLMNGKTLTTSTIF